MCDRLQIVIVNHHILWVTYKKLKRVPSWVREKSIVEGHGKTAGLDGILEKPVVDDLSSGGGPQVEIVESDHDDDEQRAYFGQREHGLQSGQEFHVQHVDRTE